MKSFRAVTLLFATFMLAALQIAVASLPLQAQVVVQQLAELTASDGVAGDGFGTSVAISGNTVVVSAPRETINGNENEGAVYVYVEPTGGWTSMTQTAKLTASNGGALTQLGATVGIGSNTIVAMGGYGCPGTAYVFVEPPTGWVDMTETAQLNGPTCYNGGGADGSVATNGSTVLLGVPWAYGFVGDAFIFVEPQGGWTSVPPVETFVHSDCDDCWWGTSLSLSTSGNTAAVVNGGTVFLFLKPKKGWGGKSAANATLSARNGDGFGSVAVSDATVIAGAPGSTINNQNQGAVYVFVRPSTGWTSGTETAKLMASDGLAGDGLGASVATSGGKSVVAGAPGANQGQGKTYAFVRPAKGWTNMRQSGEMIASDGASGDAFGSSVAISGSYIVTGAPGLAGPGAAYVFAPQ
jgi:hypothetical protein